MGDQPAPSVAAKATMAMVNVTTRLMIRDRFTSCGPRSVSVSVRVVVLGGHVVGVSGLGTAVVLGVRLVVVTVVVLVVPLVVTVVVLAVRLVLVVLVGPVVLVLVVGAVRLVLVVLVPARGVEGRVGEPPGDGRAQHRDPGAGGRLDRDPVRLDVQDGAEDPGAGEDLVAR